MSESTPRKVLCVAPHPDDETLGCGGTLLRHIAEGDEVHWLLMTTMLPGDFAAARIAARAGEIDAIAQGYGFREVHHAGWPTTRLDTLPKGDLVASVSSVFSKVRPHTVYLPYRNDVHSDHAAVFDAVAACCKHFRYPTVRCVRAYETLSETEFGIRPDDPGFRPNLFVDIAPWLERKIELMRHYVGEMEPAPFPRSEEALRALATYRGIAAGTLAAEAFVTLREIL